MPGVSNESPARMQAPYQSSPQNGSGPAPGPGPEGPAAAAAGYNRAPAPAAYQTMPNPRSAQPVAQPPAAPMASTLPRPPDALPRQVGRSAAGKPDPNALSAGQDQLDSERIDGRRALRCTVVLLDGSELFVSVLV